MCISKCVCVCVCVCERAWPKPYSNLTNNLKEHFNIAHYIAFYFTYIYKQVAQSQGHHKDLTIAVVTCFTLTTRPVYFRQLHPTSPRDIYIFFTLKKIKK